MQLEFVQQQTFCHFSFGQIETPQNGGVVDIGKNWLIVIKLISILFIFS